MKIRVMRTAEIDPITGKAVYDEVKKLKVREKKEKILNTSFIYIIHYHQRYTI